MIESPPESDDGFTLVEVLCAIVLISIATAIMLESFRVATLTLRDANEKISALRYASEFELGLPKETTETTDSISRINLGDASQWHPTELFIKRVTEGQTLSRLSISRQTSNRHYDFLVIQDIPIQ